MCAARELLKETGLTVPLLRVEMDFPEWITYVAEIDASTEIVLSPEHDRYVWVSTAELCRNIAPEIVCGQLRAAAQAIPD